jgi:membrane protease YdiL (CAAX protease family)
VAVFFVLTYGVAWLLWGPLVVFRGRPQAVGFLLGLFGSLVPSVVAVGLTGWVHGKPGVRRLLAGLLKWRVGLRWYLVVLLVPLLVPLALGISVLLGGNVPTVDTSILAVVIMFLFSIFPGSALGEELGWRGFAVPHLQDTRSALSASLIVGLVWGMWHLPLFLVNTNSRPLALFPLFVLSVVAISVLLSWLYNSTAGSMLLVVLLHATANLPVTLLSLPSAVRP